MPCNAAKGNISDEMIRERAHCIWEREGRPVGRDREHWEMARVELAEEKMREAVSQPDAGDAGDDAARPRRRRTRARGGWSPPSDTSSAGQG